MSRVTARRRQQLRRARFISNPARRHRPPQSDATVTLHDVERQKLPLTSKIAATILVFATLLHGPEAWAQGQSPIKVQSDKLHTLTFTKVLLKPKGSYDLAIASDDYGVMVIEELRRRGYNVLG